MKKNFMLAAALALSGVGLAEDKPATPATVEVGGLKATAPAGWKEETPANSMRHAQFKLEKQKGDTDDAELVVFISPGGGGIDANLKRQVNTFKLADDAKADDAIKVEDVKIGDYKGKYQIINGSYQAKAAPFDPNSKVTSKEGYSQLYVIFEDDDKKTISIRAVGPEKTIAKHKKAFEDFIKAFKK